MSSNDPMEDLLEDNEEEEEGGPWGSGVTLRCFSDKRKLATSSVSVRIGTSSYSLVVVLALNSVRRPSEEEHSSSMLALLALLEKLGRGGMVEEYACIMLADLGNDEQNAFWKLKCKCNVDRFSAFLDARR